MYFYALLSFPALSTSDSNRKNDWFDGEYKQNISASHESEREALDLGTRVENSSGNRRENGSVEEQQSCLGDQLPCM